MAGDSKSKTVEVKGRTIAPPIKTIEEQRESTAKWLAYVIAGVFALTTLVTIAALIWLDPSKTPTLLEFVKVILPALTALLGTAFGFYFSQSRLKNRD